MNPSPKRVDLWTSRRSKQSEIDCRFESPRRLTPFATRTSIGGRRHGIDRGRTILCCAEAFFHSFRLSAPPHLQATVANEARAETYRRKAFVVLWRRAPSRKAYPAARLGVLAYWHRPSRTDHLDIIAMIWWHGEPGRLPRGLGKSEQTSRTKAD